MDRLWWILEYQILYDIRVLWLVPHVTLHSVVSTPLALLFPKIKGSMQGLSIDFAFMVQGNSSTTCFDDLAGLKCWNLLLFAYRPKALGSLCMCILGGSVLSSMEIYGKANKWWFYSIVAALSMLISKWSISVDHFVAEKYSILISKHKIYLSQKCMLLRNNEFTILVAEK